MSGRKTSRKRKVYEWFIGLPTARWTQRKRVLSALASLCLLGALFYFPLFYPFIQNPLTAPSPPIKLHTNIPLPFNLTKPRPNMVADIILELTTNTDFVVGEPFDLSVSVLTPTELSLNVDDFTIVPDYALSIVQMKMVSNVGLAMWKGNQVFDYTVTGSIGLALQFYKQVSFDSVLYMKLVEELHTGPLFSIGSRDSLLLRRSQSLTMTLTFLLLLFVVLEFIRDEERNNSADSGGKNVNKRQAQEHRGWIRSLTVAVLPAPWNRTA
jgi:hypothetical protein